MYISAMPYNTENGMGLGTHTHTHYHTCTHTHTHTHTHTQSFRIIDVSFYSIAVRTFHHGTTFHAAVFLRGDCMRLSAFRLHTGYSDSADVTGK